jgi:MoxR-like ATPase
MKISNDVNAQVFAALKVAELSKVPFLFISAPGVGKSTTVEIFADIRGYHYELLRGNSVSPEECLGYDTADTSEGATSTKHLRPEWFQRILDKEAEGKHTLLFLDELTTASPYVQSALLHLVFDRSVGNEKLPADTLVVSAGNYSQSLGNQFVLIPPLMNRFCIFNIIPGINDLKAFLSAYEGASTGKDILPIADRLTPMLEEIDKQEDKTLSTSYLNKVAEFIEKAVFETTRMLIQSEKSVDLSVTEMQNIYSDTNNNDPMLRGFVTPRSLCYLVRLGVATYRCFGLDGIKSSNFRNMIEGLVGIGLSRTNKGEVQANIVTDRYADYIIKSVNDVEALNNSKVAEYAEYFNTVLKPAKGKKTTKKSFTHEEVIAVGNKIDELIKDKSISSIERPVESALLIKVSTALRETQVEYLSKIDTGTGDPSVADLSKIDIEPSELAKIITQWNAAAVVESNILKLAKDSSRGYETTTIGKIETDIEDFRRQNFRLKYLYKYAVKHAADDQKEAIKNLIPEPTKMD